MRAGIYARMSRDISGEGLGIQRQLEDCRKLAEQRGWNVGREFVDNDVSASSNKPRPAYQAMLSAVRGRDIGALIVWDLDRLTRRPIEIEDFITLADEYKLLLASVGGDVDLSTDNGRMFARIKGAVARAEVERKAARQRRAHLQVVEAGLPPTRRAFGFPGVDQRPGRGLEQAPQRLVEAEAEAIRKAYSDLLAGESVSEIARRLRRAGFTTTRGGEWTRSKTRAALCNARYAGFRRFDGVLVPGNWEPVVDEHTWRAAQALLADEDRRTNHRISTARIWLLAGLARCGACNDGTTVRVNYRAGQRTYSCRTRGHLHRRADAIDAWVELVVLEWAATPAAREFLEDRQRPDFEGLKSEAAVLRMRLTQMAEDRADGILTREQLRAGTERCRTRITEIELALAHVDRAAVIGDLAGPEPEPIWRALSIDRKRKIVDTLMVVTVMPGRAGRPGGLRFDPDTVRIDWRTGG